MTDLLLFFLFASRTLYVGLYEVFLIQLKEYRADRMMSYLKGGQGKKLLFNKKNLVKWPFFILYLIPSFSEISSYLLTVVYSAEVLLIFRNMKKTRLPVFTLRVLFGVFLATAIISSFFYISHLDNTLKMLLTDRLLLTLVFLSLSVSAVPFGIIKKIMSILAGKKISAIKITRIGITGSYGKTTTKEFTNRVLSEKFNCISTQGYNNTETAVAGMVIKSSFEGKEIFISEMGAYRKGEIKAIADIVRPDIGIITGLNNQHLDLFGSLENLFSAKLELIKGLKKGATAIFNTENRRVRDMVIKTSGIRPDLRLVICSLDGKWDFSGAEKVYAVSLKTFPDRCSFTLVMGNAEIGVEAMVGGTHLVENILLSAACGHSLGMTMNEIKRGISGITLSGKTMHLKKYKGFSVVDDTFNNNIDGVIAGIDYMQMFEGDKVLVLTPLIELGEESCVVHKKIGAYAGIRCDRIILTNSNSLSCILDGAGKNSNKFVLSEKDTKGLNGLKKGSIIYLSGKESVRFIK